jgi:hypothetical protein
MSGGMGDLYDEVLQTLRLKKFYKLSNYPILQYPLPRTSRPRLMFDVNLMEL